MFLDDCRRQIPDAGHRGQLVSADLVCGDRALVLRIVQAQEHAKVRQPVLRIPRCNGSVEVGAMVDRGPLPHQQLADGLVPQREEAQHLQTRHRVRVDGCLGAALEDRVREQQESNEPSLRPARHLSPVDLHGKPLAVHDQLQGPIADQGLAVVSAVVLVCQGLLRKPTVRATRTDVPRIFGVLGREAVAVRAREGHLGDHGVNHGDIRGVLLRDQTDDLPEASGRDLRVGAAGYPHIVL
mmetsp:Transcript_95044/g.307606  ORF Transcript_95044/g.307606 Transcript_95044/m.307606 type:complete len:240 (+) Transcript_95044:5152-5871(+)